MNEIDFKNSIDDETKIFLLNLNADFYKEIIDRIPVWIDALVSINNGKEVSLSLMIQDENSCKLYEVPLSEKEKQTLLEESKKRKTCDN